jgi:hypothetical protein
MGESPLSIASEKILTALKPSTQPTGLTLIKRSGQDLTFEWEAPDQKGGLELVSYTIYMA